MPRIILQFPVVDKAMPPVLPSAQSAALVSKVAVGLHRATETMSRYPQIVVHADEDSRRLALLMLIEVVGRAAVVEGATVGDLLSALYQLVPEQCDGKVGA
jgi:hypothetical protein